MTSQPQKTQSVHKTFHFIRFCRAFSLIILVKKTFWTSLRNDNVIVKMLNTMKLRGGSLFHTRNETKIHDSTTSHRI
jgi:hypothetical protein